MALDGVDVEPFGALTVTMQSGTARIATVTTSMAAGGFNPNAYARRSIDLYYQDVDAAGTVLLETLLYHGWVDEPAIDLRTLTVTLRCTDRLQESLDQMTKAQIDTLVGGVWHPSLFRSDASNWVYAQDRLSTVTASLDLDVNGVPRLTDWTPQLPATTYQEDDYLDGSLSVDVAQAREMVTRIRVQFSIKTVRQWWREILSGWVYSRSFSFYLERSTTLPTKSMVEAAVSAMGWGIKTVTYTELPPSGTYVVGAGPGTTNWIKTRDDFITDVTMTLQRRWTQVVEHIATIELVANESIPVHTDVLDTVEVSYSGDDDTAFDGEFDATEPLVGGTPHLDGYFYRDVDPGADLSSFGDAVLQQQYVRMVSAHRNNYVSFTLPLVSTLDLGQFIAISGSQVEASGMIVGLEHSIDTASGQAISRVRLSVMRGFAPALSFTAVPPVAFVAPAMVMPSNAPPRETQLGGDSLTQNAYEPSFYGYVGNYDPPFAGAELFPIRFRIGAPAPQPEVRDDYSDTSNIVVPVGIANQELQIIDPDA